MARKPNKNHQACVGSGSLTKKQNKNKNKQVIGYSRQDLHFMAFGESNMNFVSFLLKDAKYIEPVISEKNYGP